VAYSTDGDSWAMPCLLSGLACCIRSRTKLSDRAFWLSCSATGWPRSHVPRRRRDAGPAASKSGRHGSLQRRGQTMPLQCCISQVARPGRPDRPANPGTAFVAKWVLLPTLVQAKPEHWHWAFGVLVGTTGSAVTCSAWVGHRLDRCRFRPLRDVDPDRLLPSWLAMLHGRWSSGPCAC